MGRVPLVCDPFGTRRSTSAMATCTWIPPSPLFSQGTSPVEIHGVIIVDRRPEEGTQVLHSARRVPRAYGSMAPTSRS